MDNDSENEAARHQMKEQPEEARRETQPQWQRTENAYTDGGL